MQKDIYKINKFKLQKILANKKVSSGAKLVLMNLLFRTGGKNFAFPSQIRIASDLGLSARQIRNHLSVLKSHRILKWEKGAYNPKTKSKINSNKYDLSEILVLKKS